MITMIDLTEMKPGETGSILEIQGGDNMTKRVQAMGIVSGKKITKVSSHFWRGPQTIEVGSTKIAIGFGMAKRIFVQVER